MRKGRCICNENRFFYQHTGKGSEPKIVNTSGSCNTTQPLRIVHQVCFYCCLHFLYYPHYQNVTISNLMEVCISVPRLSTRVNTYKLFVNISIAKYLHTICFQLDILPELDFMFVLHVCIISIPVHLAIELK